MSLVALRFVLPCRKLDTGEADASKSRDRSQNVRAR